MLSGSLIHLPLVNQASILMLEPTRAGEMTSEVCVWGGRGAGLSGAKFTPPKRKSLDLTHYFSKRAQFNKINNIFEKKGPPGEPSLQEALGYPSKTGSGFGPLFLDS